MKFKRKEKAKGITLIALVITIIIMIILAGVSINAIVGDNGIITRSMEASFKSELSQYKEDSEVYVVQKQMDSNDYTTSTIFAGDTGTNSYFKNQYQALLTLYDYQITYDSMSTVTTIETEEYAEHLAVYEGSLTWFTAYADVSSNEVTWCLDLGIKVFVEGYGYWTQRADGSYGFDVYSDGTYAQTDSGEFMCTPDLSYFNTGSTYYVTYSSTESDGIAGSAIYYDVPDDWYDYSSKKWANVVTVSNAHMAYYVWIPRYAYYINSDDIDIKFVSTNDVYKDTTGAEYSLTDLGSGYVVPDAFTFDDVELSGIWVSKYEISDPREPTGFSATSDYQSIEIKSITWSGESASTDTSNTVEGADVAITISGGGVTYSVGTVDSQGKITDGVSLPYTFDGLQAGTTYTVTVETPTYYVDNMTFTKTIKTTEGSVADLTQPDLSGFNLDNTYYVTYSSTSPTIYSTAIETKSDSIYASKKIATNAPTGWYDYSSKNWANIVTIGNDGSAAYWVWIPRYEYAVDADQNICNIVFISANQTEADDGYIIPDAFEFNGVTLSGIWVSKYEIQDIAIPTGFTTQVTSSSITIMDITYEGTSQVSTGSMPNTATMTVKNSSGTVIYDDTSITISSSSGYTISNLSAGTYTITLVIPYAYSDPVSGSTTYATVESEVTVPSSGGTPNEPDVSGFTNSSTTYAYYLIFSSTSTQIGNATIGDRITSDSTAPTGWYDYSAKKWANIVVSDQALNVGQTYASISSSVNLTTWVWIPRYEYKINSSGNTVDTIFLSGISTTTDSEYSIPDAFTFNGVELTGIWTSKYEISDNSTE